MDLCWFGLMHYPLTLKSCELCYGFLCFWRTGAMAGLVFNSKGIFKLFSISVVNMSTSGMKSNSAPGSFSVRCVRSGRNLGLKGCSWDTGGLGCCRSALLYVEERRWDAFQPVNVASLFLFQCGVMVVLWKLSNISTPNQGENEHQW